MIGSDGHRMVGRRNPNRLTGIPPQRSLPIKVHLVLGETPQSLTRRIATINHLTVWELFGALSRSQPHDPQNIEGLAQLTGYPYRLLRKVVARPDRNRFTMPVLACSRCLARAGIAGTADIVTSVHRPICTKHHRWLAIRNRADSELCTQLLPELTRAQHRLRQVFLTAGPPRALQAWENAQRILHRWTERNDWPVHRNRRLAHYIDTSQNALNPLHPLANLVNYPEAVTLARVLVSPHWIAQATTSNPAGVQRFHTEIRQRLRIDYQPYDAWDPLQTWRSSDTARSAPRKPRPAD
jgi:hypothetical protein